MAKTTAQKKAAPVAKGKKKVAKHATPQKKKKNAPKKDAPPAPEPRPLNCMSWRRTVRATKTQHSVSCDKAGIVPYTLQDDLANATTGDRFWPSALFFNAKYAHGILVTNDSNDNDEPYFTESEGYTNDDIDSDSDSDDEVDGRRTLSCLTPVEAQMWCHKHAAHTAVARRFPVEVGRLLGTITLELQEVPPKKKPKGQPKSDVTSTSPLPVSLQAVVKKHPPAVEPRFPAVRFSQVRKISPKQSMDEAHREALQTSTASSTTPKERRDPKHQKVRAQEIVRQWQAVQECPQYMEHWNQRDGRLNLAPGDDHHVSLKALQLWLAKGTQAGTLVDLRQDKVCELYRGLTVVPVNATQILESLVNLSDPKSALYGVPLVAVYARMVRATAVPGTTTSHKKRRGAAPKNGNHGGVVWKVQLGI